MEEDVKTSNFYMYFGGAEEKFVRNHNIWKDGGRLHHDHATHQIEDYFEPTIVFLILLITIVSPYCVPNDTSL